MSNKKIKAFLPFIKAACIIIGLLLFIKWLSIVVLVLIALVLAGALAYCNQSNKNTPDNN